MSASVANSIMLSRLVVVAAAAFDADVDVDVVVPLLASLYRVEENGHLAHCFPRPPPFARRRSPAA